MSELTRRQTMGAITAAAAGLAVAGVATASAHTPSAKERTPEDNGAASPGEAAAFDEIFGGRRIQGFPAGAPAGAHAHHGTGYRVLVDGRELHVMRLRNNTWTSVINHYQGFPDPRATARAAVTSLKGAALVPFHHAA
ncbi:tyrosinase family oxidase copper chaperone [Streptomyces sp. CAU 1734]|uniref:apotyrosinase chaperone MelC1 n=1 Tax=Streptomyces sp. CAU 1734 TaxID=3140360 RepID=UPI0032614058